MKSEASWQYSFYTVLVDGFEFAETRNMKKHLYVIDTGTTLNYLPPRKFT
jgi:hypothetical protein